MLIRSLRRSLPLIVVLAAVLAYFTYPFIKGPLIAASRDITFMDRIELPMAAALIPIFAFILPERFEIELSLTCGVRTSHLFLSKAVPLLICSFLPMLATVLVYTYVPYDRKVYSRIQIFVPDNYKVYVIASVAVTVLLVFSLICFLRVLFRNCYIPIIGGLFFHCLAAGLNIAIRNGGKPIKSCIFDPFISNYILGDTVPSNIAAQLPELGISPHAWTYNRLLFLGISIVLLVATYVLLRREKLHSGFGD